MGGAPSEASVGNSAGDSAQPSLLQRATQSLGNRASWRQREIQAVLQVCPLSLENRLLIRFSSAQDPIIPRQGLQHRRSD